ncbi:MAG: phosphoadenosine phosphosulfate reductase family protein [Bacilli bacterium]
MTDAQYTLSARQKIDVLTEQAIARLQEHEPDEGYYLAFSGGKDSMVIHDLAVRAGVRFDPHFSQTTVDPPEVQRFIKEYYSYVAWDKPRNSMFQMIVKHRMVPTRLIRYCCSELKEIGGAGRTVVTGIRWAESTARRAREPFEQSRKIKSKWFLHPIIDWSTQDVWDYIHARNLPYCSLYDEGKERIGCIMCPMQGAKGMLADAERYPKYYRAYLHAIGKMLDVLKADGKTFTHGSTAEEVMHWWIHNADYDTETTQMELGSTA